LTYFTCANDESSSRPLGSGLLHVPDGSRVFAGRQSPRCRPGARHSDVVDIAVWFADDVRFHHLSRLPEEIKRAAARSADLTGESGPDSLHYDFRSSKIDFP